MIESSEVAALARQATGDIAVSVHLGDSREGRIEHDSGSAYPAASIIKLAVLFAVLVRVDQSRLELDDVVTLDRSKDVGGFGILVDLPDVDRLRVRELLTLMVTVSDNTATNACIDLVGLDEIADLLAAHDLHDTRLERRLMDAEAEAAGLRNEVSSRDAARLVELLVRDGGLHSELHTYAEDLLRRQRIRDRLPRRLDPRISIGNKTGEVPGVRHDVGILRYGDQTAVVAVLTNGFTDSRTLACTDGGTANDLIADIGHAVGEHLLGNGERS